MRVKLRIILLLAIVVISTRVKANESQSVADPIYQLINDVYYLIDQNNLEASVAAVSPTLTGEITIPTKISFQEDEYSVTSILEYAFAYCDNLTAINLPSTIISIGKGAFFQCDKIKEITLPKSLTTLDDFPFVNCSALENIQVASGNKNFRSEDGVLFTNDMKILCVYPEGKTNKTYETPYGVKEIGRYACTNLYLQKVYLGEGVETIGFWSFAGCNNMTYISFEPSLKTIEERAFSACFNLVRMDIPESVSYIGDGAFAACLALKKINVDEKNLYYCEVDGILYSKSKSSLIECPSGYTGRVEIPQTVRSIHREAFFNCFYVTGITLPESITSIEYATFTQCMSLTSIQIPEMVETIGELAFYNCKNLKKITIGRNVKTIESEAFRNCGSLFDFYCYKANPPEAADNIFLNSNIYKAVLHVQENCVGKYESSDVWSEFGEIIGDLPNDPGLENGVETISTDDIIRSRYIYDLHGKKVCNSMDEITKLNPGIYIINGKKVFIKRLP